MSGDETDFAINDIIADLNRNTLKAISGGSQFSTDPQVQQANSSHRERQRRKKTLAFRNPGPRMVDSFDPEQSKREMKKLSRRLRLRRNQYYDEDGRLLVDNRDLCDCLTPACPGCHFPCPKCASTKCGGECRCNRCFYYCEVETEGTKKKVKFDPLVPTTSTK